MNKTKIICTLGPASDNKETLIALENLLSAILAPTFQKKLFMQGILNHIE